MKNAPLTEGVFLYSDRESNPDLLFRRELFYPLNYQSNPIFKNLEFSFDFDNFVSLNNIADLDIVEILNVQTVVLAAEYLLDIVLETLERSQLPV